MTEHATATTGAQREKLNSLPYDLVPFQEITDAYTRVAEFGASKYAPWNWSKGLARVQLCCSMLRHIFAYIRGEDRDPESGLMHTDHILWNAASLSHNVHWNLEDGRRGEPEREYKNGATKLVSSDGFKPIIELDLTVGDNVELGEDTVNHPKGTIFIVRAVHESSVVLILPDVSNYSGTWISKMFRKVN